MRGLLSALAASGRAARAAAGLAGLAAVTAQVWPVAVGRPPDRRPAVTAAAPDGSALTRPLFDPERRAWTARGDRAALTADEPPRPVLVVRGILLDGGSARALIDDGSGERAWLGRGEGRGDWQVSAISPDRVSVTQRGRVFEADFMGPPVTLRPGLPAGRATGQPTGPALGLRP